MKHPSLTDPILSTQNDSYNVKNEDKTIQINFENDSLEDTPLFENYLNDATIHLEDPNTPGVTTRDRSEFHNDDEHDETTVKTSNTQGRLIPPEYYKVMTRGCLRAQE